MEITSASFSGHESFPFRNTWLTKGVQQCAQDPTLFLQEDALVRLGVGKNMVQSIRHWCLATQMLQEDPEAKNNRGRRLTPTAIGERIFLGPGGWDPFLEDTATLWLVHWLLATNRERATTWAYAFSFLHQPDFTRAGLEQAIRAYAERIPGAHLGASTLHRDVDVFLRTYLGSSASTGTAEESMDCPLAELGLLFEPTTDMVAFARGPKSTLPNAVFIFALSDYAQHKDEQHSFTFDELAYGPFSPGRVFKLDEPSLAERLDWLEGQTASAWSFSEAAGLKQLLLRHEFDALACLERYYRKPEPASGDAS